MSLRANNIETSQVASPQAKPLIQFDDLEALSETAARCENGAITLAWTSTKKDGGTIVVLEDIEVVLEQSSSPDFEDAVIRYQGKDRGSVITGLPEGVHYFRVRHFEDSVAAPSSVLKVNVVFFSREKLTWLLVIGAAVILATIGTVVVGYRRTAVKGSEQNCVKGGLI